MTAGSSTESKAHTPVHIPTTSDAKERYRGESYVRHNPSWHLEDSAWKAKQIWRLIRPQADAFGRVCEVGCGVGGVLAELGKLLQAHDMPAELTGYDIASVAIDRAKELWKQRQDLTFSCCDVLDMLALDFDLCLLVDVLEHLEDPVEFMRALRHKGTRECIVHLPLENNWLAIMRGRTDPRQSRVGHLHFYDRHSGLSMLERAGLRVSQWVYTPEVDLDIRHHRTGLSLLAYVPRKILLKLCPTVAVHSIGGASLMVRGSLE